MCSARALLEKLPLDFAAGVLLFYFYFYFYFYSFFYSYVCFYFYFVRVLTWRSGRT